MSLRFTMTLAGKSSNKRSVVSAIGLAPPGADQIQVIISDTVDPLRRVEILNGWRWLYNGLRERSLDGGFVGSTLYSSCPIDDLTTPSRKTSTSAAIIEDGDIAIAVGDGLTVLSGATVWLEQAFTQLRDAAREAYVWDLS